MQIGFGYRICLIVVIVILNAMWLTLCVVGVNFYFDNENFNMDTMNIPRLSKNTLFNMCSFIECRKNYKTSLFINITMTTTLCFQSVFFINKHLRERIIDNYSSFNTQYFCIYIPKLISYFSYTMTMLLHQPLHAIHHMHIDMTHYIRSQWFFIPLSVAVMMIVSSLQLHVGVNDELGWKLLVKLIRNDEVPLPEEAVIGKGEVFHVCRNPFRGGVVLLMVFANGRWDVGKVVHCGLVGIAIVVESMNEEVYYYQRFEFYKRYMRSVKRRFFGVKRYEIEKGEKEE